jgi:nucleoid-associated protein YgaU
VYEKSSKPKPLSARDQVKSQAAGMSSAAKADFTDTASHVGYETDRTSVYTVLAGDTLSKIAEHFYGDASASKMLFDVNRDQLSAPADLEPGQMLKIPAKL